MVVSDHLLICAPLPHDSLMTKFYIHLVDIKKITQDVKL